MIKEPDFPRSGARFSTTHWSLVVAAGQAAPESQRALSQLCQSYWLPLYVFVRRLGHQPQDAQDLTQAFFAQLLEKGYLRDADPARGRFRSFLLAAFKHFLAKERDRAATLKRGGGQQVISLDFTLGEDRYLLEPSHEITPERLYERRWALGLLETTLRTLQEEFARPEKARLFERLKVFLTGEVGSPSYQEVANDLGLSEGAVKVAVHRLRRRFRELLLDEIAQTVADPSEIDDELRNLFEALRLQTA